MNPVVAGIAARKASHVVGRLAMWAAGFLILGVVAVTGGLGGIGVGALSSAGSVASIPAGDTSAVVPVGGPNLTVAQIGTVAMSAGFSGSGLVMAIAVALAESSGNPSATNFDSNGTVDRGVWQINSAHLEYSAGCDYDPTCAAGAAFSISGGGTVWNAWVTYQHGAEIAYLPVAVSFVEGAGATS
jgi:hypothetical protein